MIKDLMVDEFQNSVSKYLIRHRSILDVMTKLQETNSRINRALAKSVTECGCIKIDAKKQQVPGDVEFHELRKYMKDHKSGKLCPDCREILERELGSNLFYLAAFCDLLDINLYDVILKEHEKLSTLGIYNMS